MEETTGYQQKGNRHDTWFWQQPGQRLRSMTTKCDEIVFSLTQQLAGRHKILTCQNNQYYTAISLACEAEEVNRHPSTSLWMTARLRSG